jgi:asparagine synthase (glutamine-hydrolysing)
MSMAHSIEARSPLLDYRIAELAFRIPLRFKIAEPVADGTKNKLILKELASTYLGKEYVYRKKEGFGIPIDRWLQEDQMGIVRDTLMGQGSPIFDYLDKSTVQHLVKMHLSGRKKLGAKIWNLVVFNSWLEEIHADSCM